jgi:uncharacterized protein with HEPN domain
VSSRKRSRHWLLHVEDMLDAIKAIHESLKDTTLDQFLNDRILRDAVVLNLAIIGEATRHIPLENRKNHPDIPWDELYESRNILIHEYFQRSYTGIWQEAKEDLPHVEKRLEALMQRLRVQNNS